MRSSCVFPRWWWLALSVLVLGAGCLELGEPQDPCNHDGVCDAELGETAILCPDECEPAPDALSCYASTLCLRCCGADPACQAACLAELSPTGAAQDGAIDGCVADAAGGVCASRCSAGQTPDCTACLQDACAQEITACDWAPHSGTTTCIAQLDGQDPCLSTCAAPLQGGDADTCPEDPGLLCHQACFSRLSVEGWRAYRALITCAGERCEAECFQGTGETCSACLQTSCTVALADCEAG
jgi:hypothetical protein